MRRIETANSKLMKRDQMLKKPKHAENILNVPMNSGMISKKKIKTQDKLRKQNIKLTMKGSDETLKNSAQVVNAFSSFSLALGRPKESENVPVQCISESKIEVDREKAFFSWIG